MSGTPNEGNPEGASNNEAGDEGARTPESILAEMHRRDKQRQKEMSDLTAQIASLTQAVSQQQQRQPQKQSQSSGTDLTAEQLAELSFQDPAKYAQIIAANAARAATDAALQVNQRQQQTNQIMGQLLAEYPELSDTSSELSVKAVKIFSQLPPEYQNDPRAYKEAVRDAAAELGVIVKSKRVVKDDDGSYTGGSSGGSGNSSNSSRRGGGKEKVSDATLEFAELVGLDIRDKKIVESIANREKARKKGWNRYE